MLKAVIFDMDGVLIDSEPVHFEANKSIMREFGYELSYEYYRQFIGSTLTHMWKVIKKDYDIGEDINTLNRKSETYSENIVKEHGYIPVAGVQDLVQRLHENDVKLAVASSSSMHQIVDTVKKLELDGCFDKLVTSWSVQHPKPAPDVFLKAAEELGIDCQECLVIEDSENGVRAAKSAGMACVGFINPNSGNQDLSGADYLIESFEGLEVSFFEMVCAHAGGEP